MEGSEDDGRGDERGLDEEAVGGGGRWLGAALCMSRGREESRDVEGRDFRRTFIVEMYVLLCVELLQLVELYDDCIDR